MAKKWERNFQPMVEKAKQKRSQAFKRTDEAIKLLIKEGRRINFNTVAKAANVSVPWLYKETEIKERIQQLREQQALKIELSEGTSATEASKDAMIAALKKRIKQQDEKISQLEKQQKRAYGLIRQQEELKVVIKALEDRNAELEKEKNHIWNLLTQAKAEIDGLKNLQKKIKGGKNYQDCLDDSSLPEIEY